MTFITQTSGASTSSIVQEGGISCDGFSTVRTTISKNFHSEFFDGVSSSSGIPSYIIDVTYVTQVLTQIVSFSTGAAADATADPAVTRDQLQRLVADNHAAAAIGDSNQNRPSAQLAIDAQDLLQNFDAIDGINGQRDGFIDSADLTAYVKSLQPHAATGLLSTAPTSSAAISGAHPPAAMPAVVGIDADFNSTSGIA